MGVRVVARKRPALVPGRTREITALRATFTDRFGLVNLGLWLVCTGAN